MCTDILTLFACGHPQHILPDPCLRIATTNICAGLVRNINTLDHACALCIRNLRRFRELTRENKASKAPYPDTQKEEGGRVEGGEGNGDGEDGGDFKPFEKMIYTDEAFEDLKRQCYRSVWLRVYDW